MNPDFPKTSREELEARLTALLLGELSADEAATMHRAIEQDAELAKLHARLKHTIDLVREVAASPTAPTGAQNAPLKLSDERRQKLFAQFQKLQPKPIPAARRNVKSWLLPIAASVALIMLLIAVLMPALGHAPGSKHRLLMSAADPEPRLGFDLDTDGSRRVRESEVIKDMEEARALPRAGKPQERSEAELRKNLLAQRPQVTDQLSATPPPSRPAPLTIALPQTHFAAESESEIPLVIMGAAAVAGERIALARSGTEVSQREPGLARAYSSDNPAAVQVNKDRQELAALAPGSATVTMNYGNLQSVTVVPKQTMLTHEWGFSEQAPGAAAGNIVLPPNTEHGDAARPWSDKESLRGFYDDSLNVQLPGNIQQFGGASVVQPPIVVAGVGGTGKGILAGEPASAGSGSDSALRGLGGGIGGAGGGGGLGGLGEGGLSRIGGGGMGGGVGGGLGGLRGGPGGFLGGLGGGLPAQTAAAGQGDGRALNNWAASPTPAPALQPAAPSGKSGFAEGVTRDDASALKSLDWKPISTNTGTQVAGTTPAAASGDSSVLHRYTFNNAASDSVGGAKGLRAEGFLSAAQRSTSNVVGSAGSLLPFNSNYDSLLVATNTVASRGINVQLLGFTHTTPGDLPILGKLFRNEGIDANGPSDARAQNFGVDANLNGILGEKPQIGRTMYYGGGNSASLTPGISGPLGTRPSDQGASWEVASAGYSANLIGNVNADSLPKYNLSTKAPGQTEPPAVAFRLENSDPMTAANELKSLVPQSGGSQGLLNNDQNRTAVQTRQQAGAQSISRSSTLLGSSGIGIPSTAGGAQVEPPSTGNEKQRAAELLQDGIMLRDLGRLDEAKAKLNAATKLDPGNAGAWYYENLIEEAGAKRSELTAKDMVKETQDQWYRPIPRDLPIPNPYEKRSDFSVENFSLAQNSPSGNRGLGSTPELLGTFPAMHGTTELGIDGTSQFGNGLASANGRDLEKKLNIVLPAGTADYDTSGVGTSPNSGSGKFQFTVGYTRSYTNAAAPAAAPAAANPIGAFPSTSTAPGRTSTSSDRKEQMAQAPSSAPRSGERGGSAGGIAGGRAGAAPSASALGVSPENRTITALTTSNTAWYLTQVVSNLPSGSESEKSLHLNFQDAPVSQVADYLAKTAGFKIASDMPLNGKVTVRSDQPLTKNEAVEVLNMTLAKNGYGFIRNGDTLSITPWGEYPAIYTNRAYTDIAATRSLVTQIIPLKFVDAVKMLETLQPLDSGKDHPIILSVSPGANSIVLQDSPTHIRRMVEIVKALDSPTAATSSLRVVPLTNSNASAAAQKITDSLAAQNVSSKTTTATGAAVPPTPVAIADDRANALIVMASGDELAKVDQILAELGIQTAAAKPQIEPDRPLPRPAPDAPIPQPEVQTRENAFSTFSLNVSDVAFKLAEASLQKGQMPEQASVRSEEFINAFDYRDPEPSPGVPIGFAWERAHYPFAHNRDLLRFSVKTAALGRQQGRLLNLVLVLDTSGSMERADRVRIIHEALRVLATQLQPQDRLSVVTFARTPRLIVDGVPGSQAGQVADQVSGITPEGGTNLEEAMNLAYATALRHYVANGINRVVMLTDGAANLGNVNPEVLKQKVESYRKQGIALDCFGIGWEGYNDDLLEVLSRNGDGRYGFINSPEEAAGEFAAQLAGALHVAASDVKVQVEFNPRRVTSYRQIGYAKHQLTKQQFRDNTVDAAEIAAAEAGNALYTVEVNPGGAGPLCTVRVRFRVPGTSDYREHTWDVPFNGNAVELEKSSPAMRLAATASAFSEWLVSSPFATEVTTDRLLGYLRGVPEVCGADARPRQLEWMIRQAKSISGR